MSRVESHVAAVQRKLAVGIFANWLAFSAFVGATLVALTVVLQRAIHFNLPAPARWLMVGLATVAAVVAVVMTILRRPSTESAAVAIDEKLGLKEKFSTALSVGRMNDPFARAVVLDAEQTAAGVNLSGKFPFSFPKWGYWAGVTSLLAWLEIAKMPSLDLFGREKKAEAKREQEIKIAAVQQIVKDALVKLNAVPQAMLDNEKVQLAKHNLTELLNNHKITDPEKAARMAAEAMAEADKGLRSKIADSKDFAKNEAMKSMFRNSLNPPVDAKGPVANAQREIAKGDYEEALKDIEKLTKEFDKKTEEEKKEAAKQMDNMAKALQQVAQDPRAMEKLADQMQKMGANQQQIQQAQKAIQQAAQGNPQAQQQAQQMAQQLAQQMAQGMNPQQQQAMQQQIQQAMQQAQQMANAQQQAGQMQQAAQQMAQAMQQQAQGGQQGQNGQQPQNGQAQGQGNPQQQMQQGAQQMQQALGQMQQQQMDQKMLQQLQQAMQNGANQAGGQCNNPGQQPGQNAGQGQWKPGDPQQQGQGMGGPGIGQGGQGQKTVAPFGVKTEVSKTAYNEKGQHLASIYVKDRSIKGESKAQLRQALTVGEADEGDEVDDTRADRRTQEVQKRYFKVMEEELKKSK